jgi:hypothetical protein
MPNKPIYIGLLFEESIYLRGIDDIINLIYKQFPSNTLVIDKYVVEDNSIIIQTILEDFITKYPHGYRITISNTTFVLEKCSKFFNDLKLNVPSFSIGASSSIVKKFTNVLTYAPFNKFEAMSLFLIFKEFQMKNLLILYQENLSTNLDISSLINELEIQAGYLGINIEKDFLRIGKSNYNIKSKTNIVLLADTYFLNQIVTKEFKANIPPQCYISLNSINQDIKDIFGDIPAFVMIPYSIVYNSTTQFVYENITDKLTYYFGAYPLYDILYTLNYFTGLQIDLTIQNYLSVNPYTNSLPAWVYSSSSFDLSLNGLDFGEYNAIYTKDVLVDSDRNLFLKWNNGGTLNTASSFSVFRLLGIIPFYSTKVLYDYLDYFKIYDKCENLILTRFYTNDTIYPYSYQNKKFNTGQYIDNKFIIGYNNSGYFSYLEIVNNVIKPNPQVNITMSKYPIIQYV